MSEKYPSPDWAVKLWVAGDTIFVDFGSHTVQIPTAKCSVETTVSGTPLGRQLGWYTLLNILHDRASAGHAPSIAKRGAPVQYDIEGMLRAFQQKPKPKKLRDTPTEEDREILTAFLKEQGLI